MRFPERRPQFDVWNHLESGLDQARDEFGELERALGFAKPEEVVGRPEAKTLAEFADFIFSRLSMIATTPEDSLRAGEFLDLLESENAEPWIDFATDIRFAEEGMRRATLALERYRALRLKWSTVNVSEDARALLREAVHAYLFGFDAPCIAFCGIALERVLKDALVAVGAWTLDRADGMLQAPDRVLHADLATGELNPWLTAVGDVTTAGFDAAGHPLVVGQGGIQVLLVVDSRNALNIYSGTRENGWPDSPYYVDGDTVWLSGFSIKDPTFEAPAWLYSPRTGLQHSVGVPGAQVSVAGPCLR